MNILIKDNGTGIPTSEVDLVFDLFYRGKTVERGSGLGLYLAKSATEKIGGTITLSSIVGAGTEVWVTLPV